jgi:hypothetical protein
MTEKNLSILSEEDIATIRYYWQKTREYEHDLSRLYNKQRNLTVEVESFDENYVFSAHSCNEEIQQLLHLKATKYKSFYDNYIVFNNLIHNQKTRLQIEFHRYVDFLASLDLELENRMYEEKLYSLINGLEDY